MSGLMKCIAKLLAFVRLCNMTKYLLYDNGGHKYAREN